MIKAMLLKVYNAVVDLKLDVKKIIASRKFQSLPKPNIKNTDDTIDYIIKNRCSVSRFGDGEFSILQGFGIAFQEKDIILANIYKDILCDNTPNHISCIPLSLVSCDELKKESSDYWSVYFSDKYLYIFKYLNFHKCYYDSLMTRLYMDLKDKDKSKMRFEKIKDIWNNQNVLFVEGDKSRLGVGNDLFANALSIKRLIAPSRNAFGLYDTIIKAVIENALKGDLILIALGPTATALAWDLSKLGYWAIDIGHIDVEYEWMQMGATEKVAVKNKYIGDILAFEEDLNNDLEDYRKSIIKIVNSE